MAHKSATGSVLNFPGAMNTHQLGVLTAECDILIPAALENQIDAAVAQEVKARIVAEAANGPTMPDGDAVFARRGIFMIPDILANAGGVTVSYFEWVQNQSGYYWSREEVNTRLEDKMVQAFNEVVAISTRQNLYMRTAAYVSAIGRIGEGLKMRGLLKEGGKAETGAAD